MRVELLCFDGYKSWPEGLRNIDVALWEEGFSERAELVKVFDEADAARLHFLGSPSFRVDGRELWPEDRDGYSLRCRLYRTAHGPKPCPSVAMLREVLRPCMPE